MKTGDLHDHIQVYNNKTDSSWKQLWIDQNGFILELKGQLKNEALVLKSKLLAGKNVESYYNQISSIPYSDGLVTQLWPVFDAEDHELQILFKEKYIKDN